MPRIELVNIPDTDAFDRIHVTCARTLDVPLAPAIQLHYSGCTACGASICMSPSTHALIQRRPQGSVVLLCDHCALPAQRYIMLREVPN